MATLAESAPVQELLDRAAITELLYTVARAMDTRDWDLFAACFAPEVQGDYVNAGVDGREAFVEAAKGFLSPLDATQHLVGNVRVTVEGDTAVTQATFVAQHVRAEAGGSGQYILGGNYDDGFRRTDDGWKIVKRRIRGIWSNGDPTVLTVPVS